jgi:acyl-CoA synthetase (AMP-forming)/AMP-acid ligase II
MTSLWKLWLSTRKRCSTKPVVVDAQSDCVWTGDELTSEAEKLAGNLRGPVIPICEPNSAAWFAEFLAIQKRGLTALPLDSSLPKEARRKTVRFMAAHIKSNACCVKLTSGTTGEIKPVFCSAGNLVADGIQICRTMGIRPGDVNLAVLPLGHSYGLGNLVMPLLLQGTEVICATTFLPRHILQLINKYKVTVLPTVPAILSALAQLDGAAKPSSLRLVISAGAPLSAEVAQRFHARYGIKIHNFYGSSETGGICYDRTGNTTLSGRSVGKPVAGVKVRIRKDGRVAVRSRAGNAILPDLGKWSRYGELQLLGRMGQVANIGGKKVVPLEVERVLRSLRGVRDVWVTVLKDKRGNDFLAAAVETQRARHGIELELEQSLPAWKLPKTFLLAPTLPRSDRGKLQTEELKARLSVSRP